MPERKHKINLHEPLKKHLNKKKVAKLGRDYFVDKNKTFCVYYEQNQKCFTESPFTLKESVFRIIINYVFLTEMFEKSCQCSGS